VICDNSDNCGVNTIVVPLLLYFYLIVVITLMKMI